MNTGTNNTEARAVAETAQTVQQFNFNEADIKAFLAARIAEFLPMFPDMKEINVHFGPTAGAIATSFDASWNCESACGETFAEAFAALRAKLGTPETKAAALRVEAMNLLARADELAPVATAETALRHVRRSADLDQRISEQATV